MRHNGSQYAVTQPIKLREMPEPTLRLRITFIEVVKQGAVGAKATALTSQHQSEPDLSIPHNECGENAG